MITLDHVRLLESRVEKALAFIDKLKNEKAQLESKLAGYEKRVGDLEASVRSFQTEQGRIEEGIIHALEKLNRFEDTLSPPSAVDRKKSPARQTVSVSDAVIVEETRAESEEPLELDLSDVPIAGNAPVSGISDEPGLSLDDAKESAQGVAVKVESKADAGDSPLDKATEPEFWENGDDPGTKPSKPDSTGELDIF